MIKREEKTRQVRNGDKGEEKIFIDKWSRQEEIYDGENEERWPWIRYKEKYGRENGNEWWGRRWPMNMAKKKNEIEGNDETVKKRLEGNDHNVYNCENTVKKRTNMKWKRRTCEEAFVVPSNVSGCYYFL